MLANHWNLLAEYGDFKRTKLEIQYPNSSEIFDNFITFLFKMWQLF
jgi:hypothetical protein